MMSQWADQVNCGQQLHFNLGAIENWALIGLLSRAGAWHPAWGGLGREDSKKIIQRNSNIHGDVEEREQKSSWYVWEIKWLKGVQEFGFRDNEMSFLHLVVLKPTSVLWNCLKNQKVKEKHGGKNKNFKLLQSN